MKLVRVLDIDFDQYIYEAKGTWSFHPISEIWYWSKEKKEMIHWQNFRFDESIFKDAPWMDEEGYYPLIQECLEFLGYKEVELNSCEQEIQNFWKEQERLDSIAVDVPATLVRDCFGNNGVVQQTRYRIEIPSLGISEPIDTVYVFEPNGRKFNEYYTPEIYTRYYNSGWTGTNSTHKYDVRLMTRVLEGLKSKQSIQ